MSSALNGSSAIRHFEGSDVIEICDGITFDFYTGLPHKYVAVPILNIIPLCISTAFNALYALLPLRARGALYALCRLIRH